MKLAWSLYTALAFIAVLLVSGGYWYTVQNKRSEEVKFEIPQGNTRTVAVLTLRDISPSGDFGWLAEGISANLRQQISGLPEMRLTSSFLRGRPETMPSDVDLVIDGVIQVLGTTATVTIELKDQRKNRLLWSQPFEGTDTDPVALQNEIVAQVFRYFGQTTIPDVTGDSGPRAREARSD